jgi:predicted kinase
MQHLKKRKGGTDASDADFKVYKKIKKEWEPVREKHPIIFTGNGTSRSQLKELVGK